MFSSFKRTAETFRRLVKKYFSVSKGMEQVSSGEQRWRRGQICIFTSSKDGLVTSEPFSGREGSFCMKINAGGGL